MQNNIIGNLGTKQNHTTKAKSWKLPKLSSNSSALYGVDTSITVTVQKEVRQNISI